MRIQSKYSVMDLWVGWKRLCPLLIVLLCVLGSASAQAATFVVDSASDNGALSACTAAAGDCSLRGAIGAANALAGADTITFAVGSGPATITLASALPDITSPVTIDGTTQPDYAGSPIVQINGVTGSPCLATRSSNTTIRGLDIGNCDDGISVIADNVALTNFTFERNFIGTRLTTAPINRRAISLDTVGTGTISSVNVGNATPAGRNIFCTFGFVADSLYIGGNTSNVTVTGNYFGLADDGTPLLTAARFISDIGLYATTGSSNITIGGSTAEARNVFGSGGGTQINIKIDSRHTNLTAQGNYIGTDPTGTIARRATNFAVWFFGEGEGTIRNNLITAGNTAISRGVSTTGPVTVRGNWINLRSDGTAFPAVSATAINDFSSTTGYTIGGPNPEDGNVIANYSTGISVNSPGALVQGNYVGLDPSGTAILGGGTRGIQSSFARTEPGVFIRDNRVAGCTTGIDIGSEALVTIDGNYLGTTADGSAALPNSVGLQISNAAGRAIVTNNLISGNTSHGVVLATTTIPVTMTGNRIGVSATNTPLPNGGDGIRVTSGTALKSIGTSTGAANTIAYNGGNGIGIAGGTATTVLRNSIFANSGLAIDLGVDGVTLNDDGDGDSGANGLQNAPLLTSAFTTGTTTTIRGMLNSTPNTTFTIELYANTGGDPSGFGEAEMSLTRFLVTTDASGNATIAAPVGAVADGTTISATATNMTTNDTSEMSNNIVASTTTVQFSVGTASVSESGASITLTVTRTGGTGSTTTVEYNSANGTATAGSDYSAVSGTLTFGPSDATKTIVIPITPDTLDESDETFTVTLANVGGGNLGSPATETITITDDDGAPSINVADTAALETNSGTTTMTFNVTLSAPSGQPVTVDYTTADGTATSGSDYGARFGTLTFAPGETSRDVVITVNGDVAAEADEALQLLLSSPVNASIADGTAIGTITNDDGNPSISIADATVIEGAGGSTNATLVVTLSNPSSSTVTASYATAGNTATSGSDFTPSSGTVTFVPGVTSQTITIPVTGDTTVEGNESFFVNLTNPANATLAAAQATVTIVDDDGSPALTISDLAVNESVGTATATVLLAPASAQTVKVDWTTVAGSASSGSDFTADNGTLTFTPGQTAQTIDIVINPDNISEATEAFTIALSGAVNATIADADATVTIVDDDPTPEISVGDVSVVEGGTASFDVTLSNPSASTVTVNYSTTSGTATAADYTPQSGTLTFAPNEVTKAVDVSTTTDTLQEPDETFFFDLSGASNATITRPRATATITDDDGTPSLVIGDATLAEGNSGTTTMSFTVTLAGNAAQTVTVDYATGNGTATGGSDYAPTSGTLVFTPGTTTHTIAVAVAGDSQVEANETFFVNLSNATNATISDNQALGTITNDDVAAIVPDITIGDANVAEGDGGLATMTFDITLSAPTTNTVTVNYATADGTATASNDYNATAGTLTFAPGQTGKTIEVPILGDTQNEADETFTMTLSGEVNATLATTSATGTITDDDAARLTLTVTASTINEAAGAGAATATVTRNTDTTSALSVSLTSSDATEATVPATLTIPAGQTTATFDIDAVNDNVVDGSQTVTLEASAGGLTAATAPLAVTDDESPLLTLVIAPTSISENGGTATGTVTRNTSTSAALVVQLIANDTTEATVPATVTIPAGQASATFVLSGTDDGLVDGSQTVTIASLANDFAAGQATLTVTDDDSPQLTLALSQGTLGEGGTTTATVSRNTNPANALVVTLQSSDTDEATVPGTVTIAAGQRNATFVITGVEDNALDGNQNVTITADSTGLASAQASLTVSDSGQTPAQPTPTPSPTPTTPGAPDTNSPQVAFTSPHPGALLQSFSAVRGTATDDGSGVANVSVTLQRVSDRYYWTGTSYSTTPVRLPTILQDNSWTLNADLPTGSLLLDGDYKLEAFATDAADNVGSTAVTVSIDKTVPQVAFTSPFNNARLAAFPGITGVAPDGANGSGVQRVLLTLRRAVDGRYWNGINWVTVSTTLEATLSGAPAERTFRYTGNSPSGANLLTGVYYLSAVAFDATGSRGQQTVSFRLLDLSAPTVTITSPPNGATLSQLSSINGTLVEEANGTGPAGVTLLIRRSSDGAYWNGARWAQTLVALRTTLRGSGNRLAWASATPLPAAPSTGRDVYFITALGYDRSGNRGVTTVSITATNEPATRAAT